MLDVTRGVTRVVYDGSNNPNLLSYNMQNLVPGRKYEFSVAALNFNGKGQSS
jgi:Fibronectin type III domain